MRRTSFCHLTSTYEHPCLAGSRVVGRLRARHRRSRLLHGRTSRFGGSPRCPSSGFHRVGRCRPVAMRENRTSDTPVASCPEPVELALLTLSCRPPRPPQPARVNDANQKTIQSAFHRSRTFAPQRPLGRPAPDFTSPAAWPPRCPLPTPLHPREPFWESRESWAAVHVVPLPAGITLLSASVVARRLLQPLRRTGTPFEPPILAREWSFRPAARRHQPMPVALASPVRCHTGDLRAVIRSRRLSLRRVPLARTRRIAGRGARAKAWFARSCDDVARALLVTPRAPGSPDRCASWSGEPRGSSLRPRSPSDASPRRVTPSKEPGCLLPRRSPYATGGLLPRARLDRGPVTPPPWRHCSGDSRAFFTASATPTL
jgi:hypothetical protein